MRNRDADAAPLPATDIEVSMAAGLTGLKDLLAEWRWKLDTVTALQRIGDRSLSIVTAYLAGELPPEVAAEVAKVLRAEPLLRAAHVDLFAGWQAPNAERVVSDAEIDAAYVRFKAMRTAKSGPGGGG